MTRRCMLLTMGLAAALAAAAQEVSLGEAGQRHGRSLEGSEEASWLAGAPGEEARRSESEGSVGHGGTTFWVARGKKDSEGSLSHNWGPNPSLWGEAFYRGGPMLAGSPYVAQHQRSGWESNPNLWGKRDGRGPFWAARGKRPDPFWVVRGRRDLAETTPAPLQLWAGERPTVQENKDGDMWDGENKREEGGPFWISRGKRPQPGGAASQLASLWAVRGRKSGADNTFWVARGKKETDIHGPFWAARGRRSGGESTTGPYWIARGKREDGNTPTGPYWIARGKKRDEDAVFWAARGKKDPPTWTTGNGPREEANHAFWIARGKRSGFVTPQTTDKDDDDEDNDEGHHEDLTQKAPDHYLKGFAGLAGQ